MSERIEVVSEVAQKAFCTAVMQECSEITPGKVPPRDASKFHEACREAIAQWILAGKPTEGDRCPHLAKIDHGKLM